KAGGHRLPAARRGAPGARARAHRRALQPGGRRHLARGDEGAGAPARRGRIRQLRRPRLGRRAARDAQHRRRLREPGRGQRDERHLDHEQGDGVHGARQAHRAVRPERGPLLGARRLALRAAQRRRRPRGEDHRAARRPAAAPRDGRGRTPPRARGARVAPRGAEAPRRLRRAVGEEARDQGAARDVRLKLWVLAAAAAIPLLLLEAGMRIAGFGAPLWYRIDPQTGWSLRPNKSGWYWQDGQRNYVLTNRAGFRDELRTLDPPHGTFRIAVLGDEYSEAMALALKDTWWSRLARELESCGYSEKKIDAMSFAVRGFGTAQESVLL